MNEKKFDTGKLTKLNNPKRLEDIPPAYIWEKLNLEKSDVLVEIGAGTAFFSSAFLQHSTHAKIYACDVSDVMIEWMQGNIVQKYPNIIPIRSEENSVALEDGIADLVFTINLHHELDNPDLIIKEAYRMLKPGGTLFIVDWKKNSIAEGPPAHIRFLPEQVEEQLVNSGFRHVNIFGELPKHFLVVGKK